MLTGLRHAHGIRRRLADASIPVVETWDLGPRQIDMLAGFSNSDAGAAAASHLLARGYRRLAYLGGGDDRSAARLAGMNDILKEARLEAALQIPLPIDASARAPQDAAFAMMESIEAIGRARPEGERRHAERPDAVFCSNDILAAHLVFECQRRGIAIPSQLAVLGFVDLPIARAVVPALSTVQIRTADIGTAAARLLLERLGPDADPAGRRTVDLGFTVVQRDST